MSASVSHQPPQQPGGYNPHFVLPNISIIPIGLGMSWVIINPIMKVFETYLHIERVSSVMKVFVLSSLVGCYPPNWSPIESTWYCFEDTCLGSSWLFPLDFLGRDERSLKPPTNQGTLQESQRQAREWEINPASMIPLRSKFIYWGHPIALNCCCCRYYPLVI